MVLAVYYKRLTTAVWFIYGLEIILLFIYGLEIILKDTYMKQV